MFPPTMSQVGLEHASQCISLVDANALHIALQRQTNRQTDMDENIITYMHIRLYVTMLDIIWIVFYISGPLSEAVGNFSVAAAAFHDRYIDINIAK